MPPTKILKTPVENRVVSSKRYGPPAETSKSSGELVDGELMATTKQEEWVTKKKVEQTTTRQIETRVKRQVLLEDGEVVEDTGPIVSTNTTEDTETQEHEATEHRTSGEPPVGEGWVVLPDSAIVKETTERKINTHDKKESRLETEEVEHLGELTNEEVELAIREGVDLREIRLRRQGSNEDQYVGPMMPLSSSKRIVHNSNKHNRITDTEDTCEVSRMKDGHMVTEINTKNEHDEYHHSSGSDTSEDEEELQHRKRIGGDDHNQTSKEASHSYTHTKNADFVEFLKVPKGGKLSDGIKLGEGQNVTSEDFKEEKEGDWDPFMRPPVTHTTKPRRLQGVLGKTPGYTTLVDADREDALTQKPLDFAEEEKARKSEMYKWLENHFGSSDSNLSRSSEGDEVDSRRRVLTKKAPSPSSQKIHVTMTSNPSYGVFGSRTGGVGPAKPPRQTPLSPPPNPPPMPTLNDSTRHTPTTTPMYSSTVTSSSRAYQPNEYLSNQAFTSRNGMSTNPMDENHNNQSTIYYHRINNQSNNNDTNDSMKYNHRLRNNDYYQQQSNEDNTFFKSGILKNTMNGYHNKSMNGYHNKSVFHDQQDSRGSYDNQRATTHKKNLRWSPGRSSTDRESPKEGRESGGSGSTSGRGSPPEWELHNPPVPPPRQHRAKTKVDSSEINGERRDSVDMNRTNYAATWKSPPIYNHHYQPAQKFYLGEDPFYGSIYGKEKEYPGTQPIASKHRHRHKERRTPSPAIGGTSELNRRNSGSESIHHVSFKDKRNEQNGTNVAMNDGTATLGRFSKSTTRLSNETTNHMPSDFRSQTLPRKLQSDSSRKFNFNEDKRNIRSNGTVNVSILNNVNKMNTELKNSRNLNRSQSFNVHSSSPVTHPSLNRNTKNIPIYKSNPYLEKLNDSPSLKSPGLIKSISKSQRDLTVNGQEDQTGFNSKFSKSTTQLTNGYVSNTQNNTMNKSKNKSTFLRSLYDTAPELFMHIHGREELSDVMTKKESKRSPIPPESPPPPLTSPRSPVTTRYQLKPTLSSPPGYSPSFRSNGSNDSGVGNTTRISLSRASTPLNHINSFTSTNNGYRVTPSLKQTPSFRSNGSSLSSFSSPSSPSPHVPEDFKETVRTHSTSDDPHRPSTTDTVQSYTRKTLLGKDGRSPETFESSETQKVTKSRQRFNGGEPRHVSKYHITDSQPSRNGGVVIEVRQWDQRK